MKKTFQLVHKATGEIIMYGESARICRIYAVKYTHAKAVKNKRQDVVKMCEKPNIDKTFYKLGLNESYCIEEISPIKVYSLSEVRALSWLKFHEILKKPLDK
jgi:hypothetical protein